MEKMVIFFRILYSPSKNDEFLLGLGGTEDVLVRNALFTLFHLELFLCNLDGNLSFVVFAVDFLLAELTINELRADLGEEAESRSSEGERSSVELESRVCCNEVVCGDVDSGEML